MSRPEDFSETTRRIVAGRVANYCSKPDCEVQTAGPHTLSSKTNDVGVAAHIEGARKGSARFNNSLSLEEIKAAENAIWLCQTHGDLVDNDEAAYPVSLLRQWKAEAEAKALANIGKPRGSQYRNTISDRAYEDALGYFRRRRSIKAAIDKYAELTINEMAAVFDKVYQLETGSSPARNPYKVMCETCPNQVLATDLVVKQYEIWSVERGMQPYTANLCPDCSSSEHWNRTERELQNRIVVQQAKSKQRRQRLL